MGGQKIEAKNLCRVKMPVRYIFFGNGSPLSLYLIKSTLKPDFCMKSLCFLVNTATGVLNSDTSFSASLDTFISNLMHGWYSSDEIPFEMSNTIHPFWNWEVRICNEYPTHLIHIPMQIHFSIILHHLYLCLVAVFARFPILVTIRSWEQKLHNEWWIDLGQNWCEAAVTAKNPMILNVSRSSEYSKVLLCGAGILWNYPTLICGLNVNENK